MSSMASSLIKFLDLFGKGLLKGMETLANDYDIHMNDVKDSSDPEEAKAGVSEEEVKGLIAKAMKDFAATLMAE